MDINNTVLEMQTENFKMLGLPIRYLILTMIAEAGEVGMTHYEVCEKLDRHLGAWPQLKRMTDAGLLIKITHDSRDVRYTMNHETFKEMRKALDNFL